MNTPLTAAAKAFTEICETVDNAPAIDDQLKAVFSDAHEELQYRVDKRIFFDREMKLRKEAVQEAIKFYKAQAQHLEEVHERFKEVVKAEVESAPGIEFKGKMGKIWVQDNTPGVDYAFGENRGQKLETLEFLGVPADLIKVESYKVDGEKVRALLDSGETLTWAKKKQGRGVRFPAARKPKELTE